MPNSINKAIEIFDAKIQFVSLVAKAANKRQFIITKDDGGAAQFSTYGKILKADAETHYVTGIVYEPLTEDSDGNFMTEAEIQKAARWFAKNGDKVDVQHSYEAVDGATVVESYIAPCDLTIEDTLVVKGTWVMTVEIENATLWDAIQKGEISGFSMGGVGKFSEEDIDLDDVTKAEPAATASAPAADPSAPLSEPQKKGIVKTILSALGFDVVEKGAMLDEYNRRTKADSFWNAFSALQETLSGWDYAHDTRAFTQNEEDIRDALADFNLIVTDLLLEKNISKMLSESETVNKAGKKISGANKRKLDDAYRLLTELCEDFSEADEDDDSNIEKEDPNMAITDEIRNEIAKAVTDAFAEQLKKAETPDPGLPSEKDPAAPPAPAPEVLTEEAIQKMIAETVEKAFEDRGLQKNAAAADDATSPPLSSEEVQKIVNDIVAPILKARGLPSNLNSETSQPVEKSSEAFDGFFI